MTTNTNTTRRIVSIPWADWAEDLNEEGKPVHICPVCELHIPEPNLKGRRYDKHYQAAHGEA